jgi:8-oxo-dGTP diphosphatase
MNPEMKGASGKPWGMAVKAVIRREDGCVLLLRRSATNKNFTGLWEWPGGKLDPGETFAEALLREVDEECGLRVDLFAPVGVSSFEMSAMRVVLLCMDAGLAGGEVRLSHEHDAHVWVPIAEHPQYEVVPPMRPIIVTLLQHSPAHVPQPAHTNT